MKNEIKKKLVSENTYASRTNEDDINDVLPNSYKTAKCRVISMNKYSNILAFDFNGVGCQITAVNPLIKNGFTDIKYRGKLGKDLEFKI